MPTKREMEEIDRIVDECLPDKARAEQLRKALHADFNRKAADIMPHGEADEDADELWDNVPL